ncbi:MAG: undecaprenyl-diphosphate phosphatase [Solirubrobacteraceae bacterium]
MGSPARLSLRHAIALGLAHGPAELLPISSSAHTILIPYLAGWPYGELDPELRKSFEVALHAGTAVALLVDLRSLDSHPALRALLARIGVAPTRKAVLAATDPAELSPRRALLVVALSFIPPAVVGYAFERPLQRRLSGPATIIVGLLLGGAAMALADARCPHGRRPLARASATDGLLLGLAQTCALLPGVSRSGAVLTVARARGFGRADSGTLARRIGLPVIVGASALKTGRLLQRGANSETPVGGAAISDTRALLLGGGASFLSTLAATRLRRQGRGTQTRAPLWPYALYRGLLAAGVGRRLREAHNRDG